MSLDKTTEMTGGCLCGGVRYRITGSSRPIRRENKSKTLDQCQIKGD